MPSSLNPRQDLLPDGIDTSGGGAAKFVTIA
jgi:hypothetical protein